MKNIIARIADPLIYYGVIAITYIMFVRNAESTKEWIIQHYGQEIYYKIIGFLILFMLIGSMIMIFFEIKNNTRPIVDFLIEHNLFKLLPFWLAKERLNRPETEAIYGNCWIVKKAKSLFEAKKSAESAKFFLQIVREYDCSHLHSSEMDKAIEEAYSIVSKSIIRNAKREG